MAVCPSFNPLGAYIHNVVAYVDCQAVGLAEDGYRALGAGSEFAMALDGLLAIAVAFYGYRLLLGGALSLRDAVPLVLRIGIVLALALHWSAYQPLVFNVATRGPQDLAATMFSASGLGADDRMGLIDRVQGVDNALTRILHTDAEPAAAGAAPAASTAGQLSANVQQPVINAPQEIPPEQRETLGSAQRMLSLTTLAGAVSVRVVLALLLALGPLFIASLLFDAARGLFVGWLRVLAGTTLAAVAVPAVTALELALVEPQVLALKQLVDDRRDLGSLPDQLWASSGLFALVMLAVLVGLALAAGAIRLPDPLRREIVRLFEPHAAQTERRELQLAGYPAPVREERSRAQLVADAATMIERRDIAAGWGGTNESRRIAPNDAGPERGGRDAPPVVPLGQTGIPRNRRVSAAASRRDQG